MNTFSSHVMITQVVYFIINIITLVACIITVNKSGSIGSILLITSATLTIITYTIRIFIDNIMGAVLNSNAIDI